MTIDPVKLLDDLENLLDDQGDLERSLTVKERKAIPLEDFAWPDAPGGKPKYPIDTQEHLNSAATLIGRAPEDVQPKIKARAKSIAKRHGFTLPKSWQDEDDAERAATPDIPPKDPMKPKKITVGQDPPTDPATSQEHPESTEDPQRSTPAPDVLYYAPITRIDHDRREVIGTATAEIKDAHGTVIGYEASKDAFARWAGNIREMHDPKKAVGRALEIIPDDEHRRIVVRAKISKGSQDTWEKLIDGTLTGFSIGGRNGQWTEREIDGEKLPFLARYDQSELSLVDNPSCPSAKDVAIVRADGALADGVLADEDETPEIARIPETDLERAGAKISAATRDGMHQVRDQLHSAHKQACANCNCDECQDHIGKLNKIATNDDGDGDMDAPASRALIAEVLREVLPDLLRDQVAPTLQRVNALLAHDASRAESPDFTRSFTDLGAKHEALATKLGDIEALVQRIADQPSDGGPRLHSVDKRIATQSAPAQSSDADIMRRAIELGMSPPTDPQQAVKAAAALVRPIPRY